MKIAVTTPNSETDPGDVVIEEIELPPVEDWPEEVTAEAPGTATAPKAREREIAVLDFEVPGSPIPYVELKLVFPFNFEGNVVRFIRVGRLPVGVVGDLLDSRPRDLPDLFDIYARMTGLPAPVLRGLVDVDGETVTGACYDFLPRYFRPAPMVPPASSSTSGDGAP